MKKLKKKDFFFLKRKLSPQYWHCLIPPGGETWLVKGCVCCINLEEYVCPRSAPSLTPGQPTLHTYFPLPQLWLGAASAVMSPLTLWAAPSLSVIPNSFFKLLLSCI